MSEKHTKKLVFEFDGEWVLKHRHDDELPIDRIKSELSKYNAVEITERTFTTLVAVCNEQEIDCDGLTNDILNAMYSAYPGENVAQIFNISVEDIEEVASDSQTADDTDIICGVDVSDLNNQDDIDEILENESELESLLDHFSNDKDSRPANKKTKGVSAIERINSLIGASEFKALSKEIVDVAGEINRTRSHEVFVNQSYLFSIGDGHGLTTYLTLFAELIGESQLCNMSSHPVIEESLGKYRESIEPFTNAYRVLYGGDSTTVKVFCIDISEWMNKTDNRFFKEFLRDVERFANEYIIVFRVPFVDKDILTRIKYSLSDLLSVKAISFPPFSQEEIKKCAQKEFLRYEFTVSKNAWKYFFERISEEKSDGKFYGVNTINKVVREIVYRKLLTNAKKKTKSNLITTNDVKALCCRDAYSDMSGMEQLNKLVGMDSIKNRINEIIAQIELSLRENSAERPCIHMRFVGNPGTGKTTVARIIGKILKEKGVLRVGAFFEYTGRDFCGRYVGETAPKTASICRDAYGSVLFIDEAYSLYRGDSDSRDYGREAIDALIAEMENHRSDLVVIMAGYTDDMNMLMEGNSGLASRMPYTIEFPNFSREQLYEIFVSMAKGTFKCENGLFDAVHEFFINLPEDVISSKEFSNARYVRNLFERTWAKAAMRCQLCGKTEVILSRDDFEHATADNEFVSSMAKKVRIGFNI